MRPLWVLRAMVVGCGFSWGCVASATGISAPVLERAGVFDGCVLGSTMDADGNVYFAGRWDSSGVCHEPSGSEDFDPGPGILVIPPLLADQEMIYIVKTDPEFNLIWVRFLRSTQTLGISAPVLDPDGSILIFGGFHPEPGGQILDFGDEDNPYEVWFANGNGQYGREFVWKLDSDASTRWALAFNNPYSMSGGFLPMDEEVGPDGSIYILGHLSGTVDVDPGEDTYPLTSTHVGPYPNYVKRNAVLLKLTAEGDFVWARHFDQAWHVDDLQLAVRDDGSIYLGFIYGRRVDADPGPGESIFSIPDSSNGMNSLIVHLDSNGDFLWARNHSSSSALRPLVIDRSGGVIVAQRSGLLRRYSTAGTELWNRLLEGPSDIYVWDSIAGDDDDFYLLGVVNQQSVTIGTQHGDDSDLNPFSVFVARWDVNDSQIWAARFNRLANTGLGARHSWKVMLDSTGALAIVAPADWTIDADPRPSASHVLQPYDEYDHYFLKFVSDGEVWVDFDLETPRPMDGSRDYPQRSLHNALRALNPGDRLKLLSPGGGMNVPDTGTYSKATTISAVGGPVRIGDLNP